MAKRIPLESFHVELGASFGEFAGWRVPMTYTSTLEEHLAVRRAVGVFDISHMGRVRLSGGNVIELIERVYTKKLSKTKEMTMSGPTLALNQYARVKDDEMLYRVSDEEWLLVPNAAVTDAMVKYLKMLTSSWRLDVEVEDLTSTYVMLAIQGPQAPEILSRILGGWVEDMKPLEFNMNISHKGIDIFLISRSGWTGEDGFEVWLKPSDARKLYRELLDSDVKPVGIASRDTLRIEAGFVLGGHEYGEDPKIYPCALSLRYGMGAISWDKTGYIGEGALRACRREGVRWIRTGLVMKKKHSRIIPRQGYKIYVEDQFVGWVTSGTFSPVLKRGIAQAYIDSRYNIIGEPVNIEVRGKLYEARLSDIPFIKLGINI
ncbi:MAG: glycine cleavage system aminomethyltransferase GcvT [Desulfurococcales archaeon]|nr:glycine cleavage system aminomethyltransferase GcvT [Desulfurococcales archaeon]